MEEQGVHLGLAISVVLQEVELQAAFKARLVLNAQRWSCSLKSSHKLLLILSKHLLSSPSLQAF